MQLLLADAIETSLLLRLLFSKSWEIRQNSIELFLKLIWVGSELVDYCWLLFLARSNSMASLRFYFRGWGGCRGRSWLLRDRHCSLFWFILFNLVVGYVLVQHISKRIYQLQNPQKLNFLNNVLFFQRGIDTDFFFVVFPALVGKAHDFVLGVGVCQTLVFIVAFNEVLYYFLSIWLSEKGVSLYCYFVTILNWFAAFSGH